jgi:hypothetical protein
MAADPSPHTSTAPPRHTLHHYTVNPHITMTVNYTTHIKSGLEATSFQKSGFVEFVGNHRIRDYKSDYFKVYLGSTPFISIHLKVTGRAAALEIKIIVNIFLILEIYCQ